MTRRLVRLLALSSVALAVTVQGSADTAGAGEPVRRTAQSASHDHLAGDDTHDAAAHAAQDLVGVPVGQIARRTRAHARRIAAATGAVPGRRTAGLRPAGDAVSQAAAADPGVGGAWSAVRTTPVVPIHTALLPNGKVLMWDSVGTNPTESYPVHNFTRAAVWNPVTNTATRVDVPGFNLFCAGYIQLSDGRVFLAGGNKDSALNGIVQTHLFDWRTQTWSRGPDMAAGRWYPSVAALANGEAVIVGGGPSTAEVYRTDGRLRRLTGFTSYADRRYSFLLPRPDGNVSLLGPPQQMQTFSTAAAGALLGGQNRDGIRRDYGSFATYGIGKAIVSGGGAVNVGTTLAPTSSAVLVDVGGPGSAVSSTSPMSIGRRQHNLTVLADGSVLATGGQSRSENDLVDLVHPVFAAERWDPATGAWTVLASAARVREYHSSALLLPDGRVMTGGGGVCDDCLRAGYLERNVEYFTPPYLFSKDGTWTPAKRPVIRTAPAAVRYGQTFAVASPQGGSIAKVGLVRLGAATHSVDEGQRYVPLSFTRSSTGVSVTAPHSATMAAPGYHMLFVVDTAGVPSVARIVRLAR